MKHRMVAEELIDEWNERAQTGYDICRDLAERWTDTTPDYLDRKLEGPTPVFVYGTLKFGGYNHHLLDGAAYLGKAISVQAKYEMKETYSFPVLLDRADESVQSRQRRGKVFGEMYAVDPITLLRLDQLEANGRMYQRSRQWYNLIDQKAGSIIPSVHAWTYIGLPEYWQGSNLHMINPREGATCKVYDWTDLDIVQGSA